MAATVTAVIPVGGSARHLTAQLTALAPQVAAIGGEVIVVDNHAVGLTEVLEQWRGPLTPRRVMAPAGSGAAYARNVGAGEAVGEIVIFCDADDVVQDGFVAALVAELDHADVVGAMLDLEPLNSPQVIAWLRMTELAEQRQINTLFGRTFVQCGAGCAMRRATFDALGGFDIDVRLGEDVDLSWRAHDAGFRVLAAPHARVSYRLRNTYGDLVRHQFRWHRARAELYVRFRSAGWPTTDAAAMWHDLLHLLGRLKNARSTDERRGVGVALSAWLGRTAGSIRHRVAVPRG